MLFEQMAEKITGITLYHAQEPRAFFGLSFTCFNFGAEFYSGLVRLNFGPLLMIVRY